MFSASTSLRTAQVANFGVTPAKSRSTKVRPSRCLSRGKCWFFSFLVFCGQSEKESNLVAKWSAWVHSSFTSRAQRWTRDGRTTVRFCPEIYSSRKCVRRKRYFRASLASRSGFPKRARENKSFGWKGKKRVKTSKRGCFLVFADPFLLSKKTNFSPNSLSLYSFKHRLQSPRCAWLKTKT